MPNFKNNPSPFMMAGYSYPGSSPAKKDYTKSLKYRLGGKDTQDKMDKKYSPGERTEGQKKWKNVVTNFDKGVQEFLGNPRGRARTGKAEYVKPLGAAGKPPKSTWKKNPDIKTDPWEYKKIVGTDSYMARRPKKEGSGWDEFKVNKSQKGAYEAISKLFK